MKENSISLELSKRGLLEFFSCQNVSSFNCGIVLQWLISRRRSFGLDVSIAIDSMIILFWNLVVGTFIVTRESRSFWISHFVKLRLGLTKQNHHSRSIRLLSSFGKIVLGASWAAIFGVARDHHESKTVPHHLVQEKTWTELAIVWHQLKPDRTRDSLVGAIPYRDLEIGGQLGSCLRHWRDIETPLDFFISYEPRN